MRFFRELFNKSKKCDRIGHNKVVHSISIMKEDNSYRSVAATYDAKIDVCGRCGKDLSEPYDLELDTIYNSVGLDSYKMKELRKNGWIRFNY